MHSHLGGHWTSTSPLSRTSMPQVRRLKRGRLDDLAAVLRPGEVAPVSEGPGYFKLKRAERRDPDISSIPFGQPRLLVVRRRLCELLTSLLSCAAVWICIAAALVIV